MSKTAYSAFFVCGKLKIGRVYKKSAAFLEKGWFLGIGEHCRDKKSRQKTDGWDFGGSART